MSCRVVSCRIVSCRVVSFCFDVCAVFVLCCCVLYGHYTVLACITYSSVLDLDSLILFCLLSCVPREREREREREERREKREGRREKNLALVCRCPRRSILLRRSRGRVGVVL